MMDLILAVLLMSIPIGGLAVNKNYIWAGICAGVCVLVGFADEPIGAGVAAILFIPVAAIVILVTIIQRRMLKKKQAKSIVAEEPPAEANDQNTSDKGQASKADNANSSAEKQTINIDGVEAEFKEKRNGVNIYEAKGVSDEVSKKLIAETNLNVGIALIQGDGVEKNINKGLEYLTLAADSGNIDAQHNLGTIYFCGSLTDKDTEKGIKYLKMAAENGMPVSQYNLALAYLNGDGVEKNVEQAIKYLKSSAKSDYANSYVQLSKLYLSKEHMERDLEKAQFWAEEAIKHGAGDDARALLGIISMFLEEEETAAEAQKNEAAHTEENNLTPEENYNKGRELIGNKNVKEAIKYLETAAEAGHAGAQQYCGIIFLDDKDVPKDAEKGIKYLKLAADSGLAAAQHNYAHELTKGDNIRQDLPLAGVYLEKAASNGDVQAMIIISGAYTVGLFAKKIDYDKAAYWAQKAIASGAKDAGEHYLRSIEAERSKNQNTRPNSSSQETKTNNAWRIKAFVNLIKKGEIEASDSGYVMNGEPMDAVTLYDAFVSIRMKLSPDLASDTIRQFPQSAAYIRQNKYPIDSESMGAYGIYEDMYEFNRTEFYSVFQQYFD